MKNTEMPVLIFAAVLMGMLCAVYIAGREHNKKRVLAFKAAATLVADILAITAAWNQKSAVAWCMAVGIFLYACADVLLEMKFVLGMICFGAGHICVTMGILSEAGFSLMTPVVFAVLYGTALRIFSPYLGRLKKLKIPGLIYAALLCMMSAAMIVPAFENGTFGNLARAAGSLCFVISDGIIARNFVRRTRTSFSGAVLLILYYTAVYLLAVSLY